MSATKDKIQPLTKIRINIALGSKDFLEKESQRVTILKCPSYVKPAPHMYVYYPVFSENSQVPIFAVHVFGRSCIIDKFCGTTLKCRRPIFNFWFSAILGEYKRVRYWLYEQRLKLYILGIVHSSILHSMRNELINVSKARRAQL